MWTEEDDVAQMVDDNAKLQSDIQKIGFDLENTFIHPDDYEVGDGHLLGIHTIDGLTFLGVIAGGDWEYPVFFIVYVDPKGALRGYVPEDGNTFNPLTRSAFGNASAWAGSDLDNKAAVTLGFTDAESLMDANSTFDFDWTKIRAEILSRIQVQGYI